MDWPYHIRKDIKDSYYNDPKVDFYESEIDFFSEWWLGGVLQQFGTL
jgi:hypothetical protein